MQRYFVSLDKNKNFVFNEQDVFHITKVMRCRVNDEIEAVVNGVVYILNIDNLNPLRVRIITKKNEDSELHKKITLFLPLLKSDKTDLIIQKATELGVNRIVFYNAKRSIIHLDTKDFEKKKKRYESIIKEASEQCHRLIIPSIEGVINLNDIDGYLGTTNLLAYEFMCGEITPLFSLNENEGDITFIVGPEGGFDTKEVDLLVNKGFTPISLGKRILRVETAAIYGLSVLSYLLEQKI